ncbi:MAG: acetyl-CoA carboxylase biotin carboxyl carrier protein [bacterium]
MNSDDIQQLVKIVEKSDIAELEVSSWGRKVKISKYPHTGNVNSQGGLQHYTIPAAPQQPPVMPAENRQTQTPAADATKEQPAKGEELKSPMVGTFYRAPAPDAESYVKVGDTVKEGQVLCIIEAMKLMNEVEAEFACRIVEILVENTQPVEYNQPLFLVERI